MLLEEGVLRREPALQPAERPYVTMEAWRDHAGRADLLDCVADEFERRRPTPGATPPAANH